ncbi:vWA domain-containing protein [Paenibacillus senegalensis]|uniref:VWA domain-containing protein n=1 Tax=Paenibacillus senegalensis TaxID=1465766 RepID=UPI000288452F|nr:VWA domain-containing protein [Paenibacillus senegalensis]
MKKWGLPLAAFLLLAACSEGEVTPPEPEGPAAIEHNDYAKSHLTESMIARIHHQLDNPPPLPQNEEELYKYNAGIFAGKRPAYTLKDSSVQSAQVRYALDLIADSEAVNESDWDHYTQYLYSLFKESYLSPLDSLRHWLWELGPQQDAASGPLATSSLHIQIALDLSPPMDDKMGEHTYAEVSRAVISQFVEQLPSDISFSLWLFGGEMQPGAACGAADLIYDAEQVDPAAVHDLLQKDGSEAVPSPEGSGLGQLLQAIQQKYKEASEIEKDKTTLLYVISSGASPCPEQDTAAAEAIAADYPRMKSHWIGYQVDAEGNRHLQQIAEVSDGWYQNAAGPQDLLIHLQQASEWAERWASWQEHKNGAAEPEVPVWDDVVYEWSRQWDERARRQRGNLENALMYLNSEDKIPRDAFAYVQNFLVEQYDWLTELHKTRYEELMKQNQFTF